MENETYQIVKYRPDFKSQILKLQAHLWGRNHALRAAYLEWKYDRNPYVDDTHIYLAFHGSQIVGMVGAFGCQWGNGHPGHTFTGLCFADLLIHPDHRDRNLFPKLMTFALENLSETDYAYVFDLSASPSVAIVSLMQGWRRAFIQTAQRQTNLASASVQMQDNKKAISWVAFISRQFRRLSHRVPMLTSTYHRLREMFSYRSDEQASAFANLDSNAGQQEMPPYVSLSKTSRPRDMADLVERIGTDGRIRHVRDEQYFNWRFQNPLSDYRFLFWDNGCLEGYLAIHSKPPPSADKGYGYIVDWEVSNEQVWSDLLQTVIQLGNFQTLYIWSESLSDNVKKLLQSAGFSFLAKTGSVQHDVIHGETILVKSLCRKMQPTNWIWEGRNLLDTTNWDLRMIYSDAY